MTAEQHLGSQAVAHARSIDDPERFWADAAGAIEWQVVPTQVLDRTAEPMARWFPDGRLNTCHNAVDRHVNAGRGGQVAIIHDSPVTNTVTTWTYAELLDQVARFAGVLTGCGVTMGDRVVIYMPMVPEAVVAMLACARLGAVHSVVFGGFAPHELALRIDDAQPVVIVSASCGIEVDRVIPYKPLLDEALSESAHSPDRCVILQRPQLRAELGDRDLDWDQVMSEASPVGCVSVAATDPLYVLYTSGTTGAPKGVVRDNGGHAVALHWSMANVYGLRPGETFWAASDVGWVVGHSYIVYGPLLYGATTVIYEGKPVGAPDAGAFWRVVADHQVDVLFTAPTAFRAIRKVDPDGDLVRRHDVSSLRALFLAGERLDPDTFHWASDLLGIPVIDHWWQTETGWPVAANCLGMEQLPIKPGSPTRPVPGFDVRILDDTGAEVPAGTDGIVSLRLPLPPGTLPTLYGDEARFRRSYLDRFPGFYASGDGGHFDDDGYLYVMGRIDDVINVAGHRLSTGAMEEIVSTHPAVAECAVIGVADEVKGQVPVGLVVLKDGAHIEPAVVEADLVAMVRERLGPVASFKRAVVLPRLPKTRSGKVLRSTLRAIADGVDYTAPSTIDDPLALDDARRALWGSDARTEPDVQTSRHT